MEEGSSAGQRRQGEVRHNLQQNRFKNMIAKI